jgi:hypothetical protein
MLASLFPTTILYVRTVHTRGRDTLLYNNTMQREPNSQLTVYLEIVMFIVNESDSLTIIKNVPLILKLCFHSYLYQLTAEELCLGSYCFCTVLHE